MDFHTLGTCLIAVTLLTLTPGVDTLLVIRNSARGGWRDGVISSLGICSGLFIHATVSALGISIILLQTSWAFTLLKGVGAAYLIWLGISSLKGGFSTSGTFFIKENQTTKPFRFLKSFREGFFSNVLNPKAVIFYMAFLPQFIDPTRPALYQSLLVALMHFTIAMIYGCLLAAMTGKAKHLLRTPAYNRIFNSLTGAFLIFVGLKLVMKE